MTQIINKFFLFISSLFLSVNVLTINVNNTDLEGNIPTKIVHDIQAQEIQESIIPSKSSKVSTSSIEWWKYPKNIKTTARGGNDLLVLVNKEYKLPSSYAPSDLVKASLSGIRNGANFYLRNILITHLKDLVNSAKADGIDLSIVSGYRSYSTQVSTYNYWVRYNGGNVDAADKVSARAGHSQHQLGTVLDFSSNEVSDNLGTRFNQTKANTWLQKNSYKYGFVISFPYGYERITGFSYESWHYRYIGIENALEMKNRGQILEVYLESKNP